MRRVVQFLFAGGALWVTVALHAQEVTFVRDLELPVLSGGFPFSFVPIQSSVQDRYVLSQAGIFMLREPEGGSPYFHLMATLSGNMMVRPDSRGEIDPEFGLFVTGGRALMYNLFLTSFQSQASPVGGGITSVSYDGPGNALVTKGGQVYSYNGTPENYGDFALVFSGDVPEAGAGTPRPIGLLTSQAPGADGLTRLLDYDNARVLTLNRSPGEGESVIQGSFALDAGVTSVNSLGVSSWGNIYVGDGSGGGSVYNLAGDLLQTFSTTTSVAVPVLGDPYINALKDGTIDVFDATGYHQYFDSTIFGRDLHEVTSGTFGGLTGGTGLYKTGDGMLTITGSNSYTGQTALKGGMTTFANAEALSPGTVLRFAGGTLQISPDFVPSAGTLKIATNDFQSVNIDTNGQDISFTMAATGTSSFAKLGEGTATLTGTATNSGHTFIKEGRALLGSATGLSASSHVMVGAGATLDLAGFTAEVAGIGSRDPGLFGTVPVYHSYGNIINGTVNSNGEVSIGGGLISANIHTVGGIYAFGGTFTGVFSSTSATARLWIGNGGISESVYLNGTNDLDFSELGNRSGVMIGYPAFGLTGTVTLGNANALASAGNDVEIWQGTLDLNGQQNVRAHSLQLQFGAVSVLVNGNTAQAASFVGMVTVSPNAIIGGAGDLLLSGEVSDDLDSPGSITKTGAGTLRLTGSNSYTFGTRVEAGTLRAGHDHAVGTGEVLIAGGVFLVESGVNLANEVKLAGGEYDRILNAGAELAHVLDSTSSFADSPATTAQILQGSLSASGTLTSSFASTSAAANDALRVSDVYSFHGTGTDIFSLELSMGSTRPGSYLAWLSGGEWVNAVEGNTGNNALAEQQGFLGDFAAFQSLYGNDLSAYLGAWGWSVDGGGTEVWAVINHNSDFAVIPEPATWTLAVLGLGFLACLVRRRG